jgi:hypothetical protein
MVVGLEAVVGVLSGRPRVGATRKRRCDLLPVIYTHTFLMGREALYMEADMRASIILSLLAYGLLAHSTVKEKKI